MKAAGAEFAKAPGKTPVVGSGGDLYTYVVYVQKGHALNPGKVAGRIDATLADPRSWIKGGRVRWQRVEDPEGANTICYVAAPAQVDQLCAPLKTEGQVSCCLGQRVVLNIERWKYAVPHWQGSTRSYREMVINHEFGHRSGHGHGSCPGPGQLAPVMQQQTYGLQGCRENAWPLKGEL